MLQGVLARTFVPLLLRFALAAVFIFHGLEKVHPESGYGLHWADPMPGAPSALTSAPPLQLAVAWGELLGGVLIALGLFTRVAAVVLIIIMVGAILTVTGSHGFNVVKGGFEYNFVLIMIAAALTLAGAGTFSLDRVIHVKMRGPANY